MTRSKRIRLIGRLATLPVIALVAAGCGGGGSDSPAASAPPKTASGQATISGGLNVALVQTTSRSDGMAQVTYNGHPLYLFAGDEKPGDIEGQGSTAFGGGWFALNRAGDQVSSRASTSSTNSSSPSGYAY